jgi:uncharacterized protein YeaO (DUF488 family)
MRRDVRVRRVFEAVSEDDGSRVLVDRVWPRGMSKASAHLDAWAKDVAPSTELRVWYQHEPAKFDEFRRRYLNELAEPDRAAAVDQLRELARHDSVTLLTATRDVEHSQAAVLAEALRTESLPKKGVRIRR